VLNRIRAVGKEKGVSLLSYRYLYFVLFAAYALNILGDWFWIRIAGVRGDIDYGDLWVILTAVDCFKSSGFAIYNIAEGACAYNYGQTFLHFFGFLGIGASSTWLVGPLLILVTITCFVELLRALRPEPSLTLLFLASASFLSPPVQLLFERGNLDALIFSLLCLAVISFARGWSQVAVFLITAAVTLKFYSLPTLVSSIFFIDWRKFGLFVYSTCLMSAVFLTIADLIRILGGFSVPNPMRIAFGSSTFGNVLDQYSRLDFSRVELALLGMAVVGFFVAAILVFDRRSSTLISMRNSLIYRDKFTTFAFWVFSTSFLGTYLTTMNYDYRLVLLCPLICILASHSPGLGPIPIASGLLSLWGSYNLESLPEPLLQQLLISDIPLLVFSVVLIWGLIAQVQNGLPVFLRGYKR
jgi:hypothetical protein